MKDETKEDVCGSLTERRNVEEVEAAMAALHAKIGPGWPNGPAEFQAMREAFPKLLAAAEQLEDVLLKDRGKTKEINLLTQENRAALAENERLRAALQPFADLLGGDLSQIGGGTRLVPEITAQMVKDAKAALNRPDVSTPSPTWPHVLKFAQRMEAKLALNRHKGDREGWLNDHPWNLVERLLDETVELQECFHVGADGIDCTNCEKTANEAADVANFAMMVADRVTAPSSALISAHLSPSAVKPD